MRWNILNTLDKEKSLINQLLENRGIVGEKEKEHFLNPPPVSELLKELPKEFKTSAEKAKKIIENAISKDFPIIVHGDYDADGICATAILIKILREELGHKKSFSFIPNRFEHSYGISEDSIDACIEKVEKSVGEFACAVLISVDSGITAVEAIKYAKKQGFKTIITDHHQKPSILPPADCIVWSDKLVGSGVSWVLGCVLGSKDPKSIGLAALATVTDLQPVLGFNRSIVKEGLTVLNSNPPIGLKALHEVAGRKGKEITTYDLGWVFGPRINASGRIGDAEEALQLLLEKDKLKVFEIAQQLNALNINRQDKTVEMYKVVNEFDKENLPKIIITANEEYHEGIIGLVAAKLAKEYYRPSIVISLDNEFGKGSVRSISGVDIIAFLREFEDLFESLGGHPMAAGFTIKRDRVGELEEKILKVVDELILEEHFELLLDIDLEVPLSTVDFDFIEEVEQLKPFGVGNKAPLFVSRGVSLTGFDVVGRDRTHLSMKLINEGRPYRGIFFGGAFYADDLNIGDEIDIVYSAERNEYNGRTYVNLVIKDIKKV